MRALTKHEHKWDPKTLLCELCSATFKDAWKEWARTRGFSIGQRKNELPRITQLERGVEA